MSPTLSTAESSHPYPEYQEWWPMGESLLALMADSILSHWQLLAPSENSVSSIQETVDEYISLVYGRQARPWLAASFAASTGLGTVQSGEFDALSYAFFLSAYRKLASRFSGDDLSRARREFAESVGARFFSHLSEHLALDLPQTLKNGADLALVESAIQCVGKFLLEEGYLRSHFAFRLDVSTSRDSDRIEQGADDFLLALGNSDTAYALYEMGHPVILPSASYLYQMVGEAQHHSSRTIEELFARVGCDAWETDDFDPRHYPASLVVELWQISRRNPSMR